MDFIGYFLRICQPVEVTEPAYPPYEDMKARGYLIRLFRSLVASTVDTFRDKKQLTDNWQYC